MNKKLQLLALLMVTMHGLTAFDGRKMFNDKEPESQWAFLERTFIVDAHAEKQEIWKNMQAYLPAACATIATYAYLNLTGDEATKDISKNALNSKNACLITAIVSAGICGTQIIQRYMNHTINRQIVTHFLQNWSTNRSLTPEQFHHTFDALAAIMDIHGDEVVLENSNEIVELMQFMIMRHFDKRYENVLKMQAVNNIGDAKTILDVISGSIGVAKNFGA